MSDTLCVNGMFADFGEQTLKDASGNTIVLRPQCFAVLRVLAAKSNQLVTKDELIQAVWPGTAVTDDSIVQCIHEIRQALNDEQRTVLKTVPKRGYRLVIPETPDTRIPAEPVEGKPDASRAGRADTASASTVLAAAPTRAILAAALLLIIGAGTLLVWLMGRPADGSGPPAVAVLPFHTLGGDPGRSLADGLTENLITDLARLSGIFVVARNVAYEFKNRSVAVDEVARGLGLRYVLVGSVQREGDRVRVYAQLIDGIAGHHLWAERYDGSLGDVFTLEDTVARHIASALAAEIAAAEHADGDAARSAGIEPSGRDAIPTNRPASAVIFTNAVKSIAADTSTADRIRLADLSAVDDGLGTNVFSLSGDDAAFFEIVGGSLYLKAGVDLNAAAKASYNLAVAVDDLSVGGSPDASNRFTLTLTEAGEAPTATKLN
jgi:TolB-like protein/DNA-binding winged helix-turn-helix (wHTH) protein